MKKIVSTHMADDCVSVDIEVVSTSDLRPSTVFTSFQFPCSLVNPRVALQIATLLVSDPTVPQPSSKFESDEISENKEK